MSKLRKRKVLQKYNYTCTYCGNYGDTVDHFKPVKLGGDFSYKNLVCACKSCNQLKSDKSFNSIQEVIAYLKQFDMFNPRKSKVKYKRKDYISIY